MSISKVQLFSIPVSDQDQARGFYVDVLGFDLIRDATVGPGMRWLQVRPAGAETSVTLVTWFPTMPPGSLAGVVLETEDLEAEVGRLRGRGVAFEGEIREAPWGRSIVLLDPDRNRLVLQHTRSEPHSAAT